MKFTGYRNQHKYAMAGVSSKIGFIGGGKIAHAMAQGFIAAGNVLVI